MSEVASRLYGSAAAAQNAANALHDAGYRAHEVTVLSKAADAYAAARAAGVFKGRATALAEGVAKGGTAVICRARFWDGLVTRRILDAHDPVDRGDASGSVSSADAESAPLSDMLGLRVLGGRGDLFSSLFGLSALSRNQRGKAALSANQHGKAKLSGSTGPYKPIIPMPLLSANQRGKAKLSDSRGGYKPIIPFPTLSGKRG